MATYDVIDMRIYENDEEPGAPATVMATIRVTDGDRVNDLTSGATTDNLPPDEQGRKQALIDHLRTFLERP